MYQNILVAIALDHERDTGRALTAARLLAGDGATITAINVMEEIPSYVANEIPAGYLANRRQETEDQLKKELGGASDITPVVVGGHAGRTLIDHAAENDVDCIVISSHRPGLQDYFLGSTAQRVIRHAQCSVHVLR